MKTPVGSFELKIPRDRAGHFEPQVVKKHQTQLTDELVRTHIADLYGMSLSNVTLNATESALDLPGAELEFNILAIGNLFSRVPE